MLKHSFLLCVQVNESFPFPIALTWKASAGDAQNGASGDNLQSTVVFPKGNPIPSMKALTFYRSQTFGLDVQYSDVSELQAPAKISHYTVSLRCKFILIHQSIPSRAL